VVTKGKEKAEEKKKEPSFVCALDLPATEFFKTGFPSLDEILSGGFVVRSIVELYGEESEGKTTLGFQLLSKAQQDGYKVLFVDAEHCATKEYMASFMDLSNLSYCLPVTAEEAFDAIRGFYDKYREQKNMLLIDSVAALAPEREVEEGSPKIAELASIMSSKLRGSILSNYKNSIAIFTNQERSKIDINNPRNKGTVNPGGKALRYYAGYRLKLDTVNRIIVGNDEEGKESIGKTVSVYVDKTKFGKPYGRRTLDLLFGKGFSRESDIINHAIDKGVVVESGAWFSYSDIKIQGRFNFLERVTNDRELFDRIQADCQVIRKALV
jgi:recombination protein RecA